MIEFLRHHEGSQVDRAQSVGRQQWSIATNEWSIATNARSFPQGDNDDEKYIFVSQKCQNINGYHSWKLSPEK